MAEERKDNAQTLDAKLAQIEKFPGNLTDYQAFKGKEYEIMDVPGSYKYVNLTRRSWESIYCRTNRDKLIFEQLLSQGWTAIINWRPDTDSTEYKKFSNEEGYGIPVREKCTVQQVKLT
jgi:hypothetical protein